LWFAVVGEGAGEGVVVADDCIGVGEPKKRDAGVGFEERRMRRNADAAEEALADAAEGGISGC